MTVLRGLAISYNNRDSSGDIILPGALDLSSCLNTPVLYEHDSGQILGKIRKFFDQPYGVEIEFEIYDECSKYNEVMRLYNEKIQFGLSIGYRVVQMEHDAQQFARILKKIQLLEVSVVLFPANPLCLLYKSDYKRAETIQLSATVVEAT